MSAPRAVRIPRAPPSSTLTTAPDAVPAPPVAAASQRRPNRAGTQRVVRLTAIFLILLVALYVGFELYARTGPAAHGSAATDEFVEFTTVAFTLAVVGALLTLSPAPRAVEVSDDRLVIIGRWGRRTEWSPRPKVVVHRVRRYPAGFFSEADVDSIEVSVPGKRRSYLVETGLLPENPDA